MTIYDMGMYFDGKCAICREWIECYGDPTGKLDEPTTAARHNVVHARCHPDQELMRSAAAEFSLNVDGTPLTPASEENHSPEEGTR